MTKTALDLARWLGYLTEEEVKYIQELCKTLPTRPTIVNIGAGAGTSGLAIAEARPDATRYTIDISPGGPLGGLEGERNAFKAAGVKYPIQILGDSKEIGVHWDKMIDLLFVDGDHSREGISGDIDAWVRHVVKDGIVIFHDYLMSQWPAVKEVVDEKMRDKQALGVVHRIKAFRV